MADLLNGGTFQDIQDAIDAIPFQKYKPNRFGGILRLQGTFTGNTTIVVPSGKECFIATGLYDWTNPSSPENAAGPAHLVRTGNNPIFQAEDNFAIELNNMFMENGDGSNGLAPFVQLHNCNRAVVEGIKCPNIEDNGIVLSRSVPETDTIGTRIKYCGVVGPASGYAGSGIKLFGGGWNTVYLYRNTIYNCSIGAELDGIEYLFLNTSLYNRCITGIQITNLAHPEMQDNWYRNAFPLCQNQIVIG